jgi:outer membrane protein assembly factor BamD
VFASPTALLRRTPLLAALGLALACASTPEELPEPPSAEELYRQGLDILEGRNFLVYRHVNTQEAIDKFQEIVDNYPYSEFAVTAELAIADAYFDDERYEEALSYYQDFPELHPNHERVPYTMLRAALCHYERVRSPNRDQRPTREALAHLDKLMSVYPYTPEAQEAEKIWRELRQRLGQSVIVVAEYYMEREEWQSAADRFREVLNQYPGLGLDADALYKLGVCYQHMQLDDEAQRVFQVILDNYQGTDVAEAAADIVSAAQ